MRVVSVAERSSERNSRARKVRDARRHAKLRPDRNPQRAVQEQSLVGRVIGPYELQSIIGAGGMGTVYKARDTRLGRTVAIKVLPPEVADDPAAREQFAREGRAIAALNHPHICT